MIYSTKEDTEEGRERIRRLKTIAILILLAIAMFLFVAYSLKATGLVIGKEKILGSRQEIFEEPQITIIEEPQEKTKQTPRSDRTEKGH